MRSRHRRPLRRHLGRGTRTGRSCSGGDRRRRYGGGRRLREARARETLLPDAEYATRWFVPAEGRGSGATDDELYDNLLTKLLIQEGGVAILEAGGRIEPAAFQVARSDLANAQAAAASTRTELIAAAHSLREAAADVAARIFRLPPDDYSIAYNALCAEREAMLKLRVEMVRGRILRANISDLPMAGAANALDQNFARMEPLRGEILARLETVPSPISFGGADMSLAAQLRLEAYADESAAWLLDRADLIGARLLNRLCRRVASNGELR